MLLVLHGAKKNVGDFLIRERGLALIRRLRPSQEVVLHDRWRALDPDVMRRADAVVLCGGPGLASHFYPRVFPLIANLKDVITPVLPVALGWSGQPAEDPERFRFDEPSLGALREIHRRIGWSGVRDDLSLGVMERAQVGDVRRTGCVAWYHLPSLGKSPAVGPVVRRVVVTPPADAPTLLRETSRLLRAIARRHPNAERFCVFHRGLRPGNGTRRKEAAAVNLLGVVARALGYKIVDAAYRLSSIDFYENADLHVGYRVHAHLSFLSARRPTFLISEDGRGIGQAATLGDTYGFRAGEPALVQRVMAAVEVEQREGHPSLHRAVEEIERTWPVMRSTLEQLPDR